MTFNAYFAFSVGMALLAISPGPGLAAILSRSIVSGKGAGFMVVTGLVLADFLFLGLAMFGLSKIASLLGPFFQVIKFTAAAYLIYLGYKAIRSAGSPLPIRETISSSAARDVALGALVTLGNPKAILFYGAFLPTFFDVAALDFSAYLIVCCIIVVTSYAVYGAYMGIFEESRRFLSFSKRQKNIEQGIGAILIGSGVVVATR